MENINEKRAYCKRFFSSWCASPFDVQPIDWQTGELIVLSSDHCVSAVDKSIPFVMWTFYILCALSYGSCFSMQLICKTNTVETAQRLIIMFICVILNVHRRVRLISKREHTLEG